MKGTVETLAKIVVSSLDERGKPLSLTQRPGLNEQVQGAVEEFIRSDEFLKLEGRSTWLDFGCLVLRPHSYGIRYGVSLDLCHP